MAVNVPAKLVMQLMSGTVTERSLLAMGCCESLLWVMLDKSLVLATHAAPLPVLLMPCRRSC